jgi:hypothetical protein
MSKQTPRFTINEAELAFRQDIATVAYNSGFQHSAINDGATAILTFQYDKIQDAFPAFAELLSQGWSIPVGMELTYVCVVPAIPGHTLSPFTEISLLKPAEQREADLKLVHQHVEQTYRAELAAQRDAEVERVTQQQIEAARRKREVESAQAEAAELAAIRAEVESAISGGK